MARGMLIVESRPSSEDRRDEFDEWYVEVHMPEVLALDGFVSARRFRPLDGDGPYVSVYDMEGDDIGAIAKSMFAHARNGGFQMSDAMQFDPPPAMRVMELTTDLARAV
ncbi:DUF4286 family protein [Gordonia insulae]|uniref:EthD domain-containing protein n=1 Tax=Gordonia insulae TaxID=2420509 RepID=A0A3G8JLP6_9ACTN|nr:DUF4286 family protein [Gordonia insulae]AZG45808.1 hypothetical protein D7316_02408 [Gordonia insulae]